MNVLVTGGAGYIGSHAALRLLVDGHGVTVVDNLSRGHLGAIDALESVGRVHFVEGDFGDEAEMAKLMRARSIDLVMHFAALTYVGESVEFPLRYYRNNTASACSLLEAMEEAGVSRIVFSSTAATYGEPDSKHVPIVESCLQRPVNPYGRSKLVVEQILLDHLRAKTARGQAFSCAMLRYFNVAGCDRQGRLGEDHDPETHLIPICLDAALDRHRKVTIFGTDYETPDGTCIRDYVHVEDLVDAHVMVMDALGPGDGLIYNIGVGSAYSVRQVIGACRVVTGVDFPAVEGRRRQGDPPMLCADPAKIRRERGWRARTGELQKIIETAWRWRRQHPEGYGR